MSTQGWSEGHLPSSRSAGCLARAGCAATSGWRRDLPMCHALCSSDFGLSMNFRRVGAFLLPCRVPGAG